jgi:2-polyprenyl-3-methyl-5-hydroxy-6-metoxy-1,4-benzoquinol methylase
MKLIKCNICRGTLKNEGLLDVCISCGHGFREYMGDIIEYHAKDYRKMFGRTSNEFDKNGNVTQRFHDARKKIVSDRYQMIKKYLGKDKTVLDIGSGAGTFAKMISPDSKSIECLEVDPALVKESKRLGFKTYHSDFESQNFTEKYDIVFAWHVLEHIVDIDSFISKCKDLSNEYIIMEVPSKRTAKARFDGHVHYFNEKSLSKLFENHGIELVEMKDGVQMPAILAAFKIQK